MFRKSPLSIAVGIALAASTSGISPQVLAQEVEGDDAAVEEIVVVGSRIRKDAFSSSSPIDIVLTETAQLRGISDVAEMLQTAVIAAGSPQITPAETTAFARAGDGGTGTSTLSLRGLGASRTLSLLNGRRAGPAGTRGGVSSFDLNVIPLAAIERVEILKDGASSIYGSDAVAGVVNYITKKGDGATLEAYTSQTSETGGEVSRISASFGKSFSRGNFRVTGDFYRNEELANGDRDYYACGADYTFDPDTGARNDRIDSRTGEPWCGAGTLWGQVWLYDYNWLYGYDTNIPGTSLGADALIQFDYDGDLGNYIPIQPTPPGSPTDLTAPPGWYMVGYDRLSDGVTNTSHPAELGATVIPKIERKTFYADAEFDLSDSVTLYGEALLNRRETTTNGFRQFWIYMYNYDGGGIWGTNSLAPGWTGINELSPTPVTDHSGSFIQVDYQRYLVGIRGDLNGNWSFDLNFQHSKSDGSYTEDIIWADSRNSQMYLSGSCEGTVTSVRGVPCVDIPWLDPAFLSGDISPEARDFLFGSQTGNTEYTQSSFEGFISGDLFELPAGTVQGVFGLHYRDDKIRDVPGEAAQLGNSWGDSTAGITEGSDTTKAVFTEFEIPLLADKTGFQDLTLNASMRFTDVDSYGSDSTYKVGLNWQMVDSFRLRANRGTSFRTPALFELYLADQTGFLRQSDVDPCIRWGNALDAGNISQRTADNCAAETTDEYAGGLPPDFTGANVDATAISRGGFGLLEAERSESTTVGLIWTPEFADFSVAIDHFDIEVNDQVDQLGASLVRGCYASEFFPDDPLCDLFDRSIAGSGVDNIQDLFINVATQQNSGWDLSARYSTDIKGGTLIVNTQHTWQVEADTALFEGFKRDTNGWFGDPKWVGQLDMTYIKGDWLFFWGVDVIGKVSSLEDFGGDDTTTVRGEPARVVLAADAQVYHDFSVTKAFDNGITVIGGLSNAFDKNPPKVTTLNLGVVSFLGQAPFYSQYDMLGRRAFLQLRYEFL